MPNAHNAFYDTMLELGYVGYYLLLVFIFTTLHAIPRSHGATWLGRRSCSHALYILSALTTSKARGCAVLNPFAGYF
jgi:hypothetical protein